MSLRKPFAVAVGRLFICVALYVACSNTQAQPKDAFLEAQITAIQTLDTKPLEVFNFSAAPNKLAAELTKTAVNEFTLQVKERRVPEFTVSREGAELTVKFINHGADTAINEDPNGARRSEMISHLKQFVSEMIKASVPERGKIGKSTFVAASGLCPLWPFC